MPRVLHRLLPAVAAAALLAIPLAAQQQRTAAEYAALLEGAERVARMQVPRVVADLGLSPGMAVADIGAGSGLFTRPIAQAIAPGGTAYAVDIDGGLLEILQARAREAGIGNIRTVLGAADDPKIPEPVDVVLICDTLHHIENRGAYLKRVAGYVKPGGTVVLIDFTDQWPGGHESMRYTVDQLAEWMADAGFTRVGSHDYLENAFFVVYRLSTSTTSETT
jgi:2-polyprenyl-3-methyl-5-hydroxy-6-metoxy-1,4-benzoquinol methylase